MIIGDYYNVGMDNYVMWSRGGDPTLQGRSTCCYTLRSDRICNERGVSDNGGLLQWGIVGDNGGLLQCGHG